MPIELLEGLYKQINDLRQSGLKMKDIASYIDLPPSVLSALYSTVLPTFISNQNTKTKEEALDYAISQVNNVSKKRLLTTASEICLRLQNFNPNSNSLAEDKFIGILDRFAKNTNNIAFSYLGLYTSYSISSARDALKVESFILTNGDNGQIKAIRKSAYNSINTGIAIVANGHSMYIMLNESDESQLALVTIYLQLPFYEKATFLRGIYITLDYNRNPIARRILFVKKGDLTNIEELDKLSGEIIEKENLMDELNIYYDYVSGISDVVKMCSIPFSKFNEEDLITEKNILSTINKK